MNNAGFGAPKSLLDANIKDLRQMIVLNVEVPMRLSYAAVPAFVGRGSGAIINVASIAAVAPEILNGVYGGTKAFLMAFGKSLQHEFGNSNLRVQVVLPGATATNFWKTTGTSAEHLPREIVMPVGDMVDAALAGFDQGELTLFPLFPTSPNEMPMNLRARFCSHICLVQWQPIAIESDAIAVETSSFRRKKRSISTDYITLFNDLRMDTRLHSSQRPDKQ